MRSVVVGVALAILATHASADPTTAKAAFEQGEKLTLQNKWTEACPYFEASFKADPQLGALLALAECYEQTGRIASSWSELKDALELAMSRGDARRADIEAAIKDLGPRVPKLKVTPPKDAIPGLVIKRDDIDITLLVSTGTEIPTDPGEHDVSAEAPGYQPSHQKVTTKESEITNVDIPALAKVAANAHDGKVTIKSAPNAQITLDAKVVGTGSFVGSVKPGGHTLRVTAPGKRAYQNEILVGADEARIIDVPLEDEAIGGMPKGPSGPSFELGAGLSSGMKLRHENPLVVAVRLDLAFRLGRRINFGSYAEYGSIDTGDRCGLDMPGPFLGSELDFGTRNQFTKCTYLLLGSQLYIHIHPGQKIDPYFGIAPGFRFAFVDWNPYYAGVAREPKSDWLPGILTGVRVGVNYHPRRDFKAWEIGGFVEASVTIAADEQAEDGMDEGAQHYVTLFAGLRSSLQL